MTNPALLLLADARFPTGGHAHSAGVEAAVSIGDVRDADSLGRYLCARLATTGRVDAAFAGATVVAIERSTTERALTTVLDLLDAEYSARVPSPYLRDVSRRLGRQLGRAATRTWPSAALAVVVAMPAGAHQPVALGAAAASAGLAAGEAALLAVHHLAGAVATAGVRLLGLDPIEVAALQADAVARAGDTALGDQPWLVDTPADLPAAGGVLTEILGEHHGSLDARLFVA